MRALLLADALLESADEFLEPAALEPVPRPATWGDCRGHTGPCPWVGCRAHRYLEINEGTGTIKLNFPDLDPLELDDPCTLAIAERGALTLEETGVKVNLTRERVRQVEVMALRKLRRSAP